MMENCILSCREARHVDLIEYLEKLGFDPQKIRNNDYWYLSPLREEKEPSFKVNRKLNVWYDFALGKGGNIIDFGILYHNCSVKEMLEKLRTTSFLPAQISPVSKQENEDERKRINLLTATAIKAPILCNYLVQRKIPIELADVYLKEVRYELNWKIYTALGFRNNAGGYELRTPYFKGSSSPKDVTLVDNCAPRITVIEGFFSFLSYLVLHQNQEQALTNFLVLNSLSFLEKSRSIMEKHEVIHLFLDQDNAGVRSAQKALTWDQKYIDKSALYKDHKDLNEFLFHQHHGTKQNRRLRMRF
jgi:hypothetical protein